MSRSDDEAPWTRHLAVAVAAVAVVAAVIGGVVSVVALGAARVTGLGESQPTATARPSLYIPSGVPTTTVEAFPNPPGVGDGGGAAARPSARPSRPPRQPAPALTLRASPRQVAAGDRITLSGRYRGRDAGSLQVQRFSGGWVDFPVQAAVRSGRYSTYIITTRTGVNRLRMLDLDSGTTSPQVKVTVD